MTSFDLFVGYLVLDAWIANPDRHDENWSVIEAPSGSFTLAPSYDHGNSLGFNLLDPDRASFLDRGLQSWARRGFAVRFEDCRTVTLVDFAHNALAMCSPGVHEYWLARLSAVNLEQCDAAVAPAPNMSDLARRFCLELLDVNRRRLLNEH